MNGNRLAAALILILAFVPTGRTQAQGKRVDWSEKRFVFEMREKPWSDVMAWFADQTQLPYSTPPMLLGTFTFIPMKDAKGIPRKYSLVEIYDILNEALHRDKWCLLRGEALTLWPADEDPPPEIWPVRVMFADLPQRGRTDFVEVEVTLKPGVDADEVARELQRLFRPFGRVNPVPKSNTLIMRASVASLVRNREVIEEFTIPVAVPPASPAVVASCEYVPPCRPRLLGRLFRR